MSAIQDALNAEIDSLIRRLQRARDAIKDALDAAPAENYAQAMGDLLHALDINEGGDLRMLAVYLLPYDCAHCGRSEMHCQCKKPT